MLTIATHILHQLKSLMSRNLKKFNQLHISKLIFNTNMIIIKTKLSVENSKSPNANPFYHKETHQNSFKSTGSCSSPISYADVVKKVNVEEPTHGFPAASSTSFNNIKKLNSAVHTTSMKENHKSVAILAPTLPSSNISINETKFNVFPVPGDGNCFFIHSVLF